jgi:beta-glucanase (GH16 family)
MKSKGNKPKKSSNHIYRIMGEYINILIFAFIFFSMNSCIEKEVAVPECDPCTSPTTYAGYSSVFTEEFNGVVLENTWSYLVGNGCPNNCGFRTGELQLYQDSNVSLRDGNLVITAKKETVGTNLYTSGRITTFDSLSLTYGRIDVRAKLPKGQGLWPAIWLLGDNSREVGWPSAGQIFIMQMRGGESENRDNTITGGLTWGERSNPKFVFGTTSLNKGIFNEKFHVFSIIWEPSKIQWLLNDKIYLEQKIDASMNGTYNKPFHLILNVAVGGLFPGNPDSNTSFPQEMVVDYIRVFQSN